MLGKDPPAPRFVGKQRTARDLMLLSDVNIIDTAIRRSSVVS